MKDNKPKVLYLYAGPRREFFEKWKIGLVGDTQLLGLNYMSEYGVDAEFLEWPFAEWLRKINFNLVHLPYLITLRRYDAVFICAGLPLVFLAKYILRWKKPKFVIYNTFLTNALKRNSKGIFGFLVRKAIGGLDVIVCTAREQEKFLVDQGFDLKRVIFRPIGIDAARFSKTPKWQGPSLPEAGTGKDGPCHGYILTVGRDPGRDYKTLFEAVRNLTVKVKVATKQEVIAGLQIPNNVEILLNVPYENMPALYQNALFAVVPLRDWNDPKGSDTSGQYGFLEPMATGKAVIVSDKSTVRDYIQNGVDGFLVPPDNPEALRETIQKLLTDENLRNRLGAAAQKKVREQFTSKKFAESLAEIFRRLSQFGKN